MSIAVPRRALNDYTLAKDYLCRDACERAIFARIERSPAQLRLRIDRRGDDRFDPNTNSVWWDPYSALRTTRGGRQSPALGLGHELDHAAALQDREQRRLHQAVPRYDNREERRVIPARNATQREPSARQCASITADRSTALRHRFRAEGGWVPCASRE